MNKSVLIVLMVFHLCLSAKAQRNDFLTVVSPALSKFLVEHPAAFKILAKTDAFTNRTIEVYYFYTEDEARAKASHSFPSASEVVFHIRENQEPADEFLCLIYEFINSENDEHFGELIKMAKSGSIARDVFAKKVVEAEFKAAKTLRDMLPAFKFTDKETAQSAYYKKFKNTPDNYDAFIAYGQRLNSPHRDVVKEYEATYDRLRKSK